jgi:hypothetical protein
MRQANARGDELGLSEAGASYADRVGAVRALVAGLGGGLNGSIHTTSTLRRLRRPGCARKFGRPEPCCRLALALSLHAKCVVVGRREGVRRVGDFTEAAQLRNIELGIVVHEATSAFVIEQNFEALIKEAHLRRLLLSS